MKDLINKKFKVSYTPYLQGFDVKDEVTDEPMAHVSIYFNEDRSSDAEYAQQKAQRIADCLNHCQGMEL